MAAQRAVARVKASPLGYRLATGVFWSMAGAVISRGLMMVATICVARLLGKRAYGELGMIQSTVGMFGVFAGFGLGLTATKHVAELRQSDPARAGRIVVLSGLAASITGGAMAAGLFVFAPWLAENTIDAPHLCGVLRIGSLMLLLSAVNGAQTGALAGFEAFKTIARVNLVVGLLSFPMLVAGAYFGGLAGSVWALVANLSLNWILNHLALRNEAARSNVPLAFCHLRQEFHILWRFAVPAALAGVMTGPAEWTCRAVLANRSGGYDEIGLLSAALLFQTVVMFAGSMLGGPLLSMVSNAGSRMSRRLAVLNIMSTWILGVVVALPLLCYPELAQLALGHDYSTASFRLTVCLVAFCTTVMMFKTGITRVLVARNLVWWGFLSNSVWAVSLIASSLLLVRFGAVGVAGALTIAHIISALALFPLYHSMKLIPQGTLFSGESQSIWAILTLLLLLDITDASRMIRTVAFISTMPLVVILFVRMLETETVASHGGADKPREPL